MHVKTECFSGDTDRDMLVHHPFNVSYESRRGTVYKLHKTLCRFRKAPLHWFKKLGRVSRSGSQVSATLIG